VLLVYFTNTTQTLEDLRSMIQDHDFYRILHDLDLRFFFEKDINLILSF
jgi:hypothetical protein